jgi:hypothetical protein
MLTNNTELAEKLKGRKWSEFSKIDRRGIPRRIKLILLTS